MHSWLHYQIDHHCWPDLSMLSNQTRHINRSCGLTEIEDVGELSSRTFGAMDVESWEAVDEIDSGPASALREHYDTPLQLYSDFDDYEGASSLIELTLGSIYGVHRREAISQALLEWHHGFGQRAKRARRIQLERVREGGALFHVVAASSRDVYEAEVMHSPQLAVAQLEKLLRRGSQRSSLAGKAEREEAERKRWALELAGIIKEAGLPVTDIVKESRDENAAWVRAFGSRRFRTLRTRFTTWTKVRQWLRCTYGRPWPGSAAEMPLYLEERHEVQALGKTVPAGIQSSLLLLETIGQVSSSHRISDDPLWCESVKSWTAQLEEV